MAPNPIVIPRNVLKDPTQQEKVDPLFRICYIPTSIAFASCAVLLVTKYEWAQSWLLSGAPILTYIVLVGASYGFRILPFLHLWTLLASINLLYSIAATSWLLHGFYAASCWPAIFVASLFQFNLVANFVRGKLRTLLSRLQFVHDKIAFFDIPALEIDVDVAGLMVVRGLTISLSSLTIEAHGIELGIKLTDDMELAIQVELVRVLLFRRIEVSDIFANLKGGVYEMTFGRLEENTEDDQGNALMNENTPLLRAASGKTDGTFPRPEKVKMTEHMTNGKTPQDTSAMNGLESMTKLLPSNDIAIRKFDETMEWIHATSPVKRLRKKLGETGGDDYTKSKKSLKAAICSHLHDTPSVPHPPLQSIKVTTLKNVAPVWVQRFQHRLPLLLRLLLSPLRYFHTNSYKSITGTASGQWIRHMLLDHIFKGYAENDSDLRNLEARMAAWLADANFALEMDDITGFAQVPVITDYDINCYLGMKDVLIYRTLPKEVILTEVVRLGGADATFTIPTFLLPHHEHILPSRPSTQDKQDIKDNIENADGKPQQIQAEKELEQAEKDETNVQMSVHARLPACLDQELLNFVAALVKATKLVELEKEPSTEGEKDGSRFKDVVRSLNMNHKEGEKDGKGFKDAVRSLNTATKDNFKKAVVNAAVNDRWIAKLVGKITKMLETAQGDLGYSGNIPVALKPYRDMGAGAASKLLP